jgi:molybdopterin-guanine dinucleotide biosynthesis protein A
VASGADAALAADGKRTQPLFLLLRVAVAPSLQDYLKSGGRKVETWLGQVRATTVDCSDVADTFANVNDADERRLVEARLLGTTDPHSSSMA